MTPHRYQLLAAAALAAALAAVLAGCGAGSSSPNSSSSTEHPTQAQMLQAAVNFADCMHSHGVPLPDPTTSPRGYKNTFAPQSTIAQSPAFQSAYKTCRRLLPNDGAPNQSAPRSPAQIAAMLAFARCIRSHGFPSFPDPNRSGELTHEMVATAGISLHQPAVQQAGDACVGVTHGVITKAIVAHFAAGQ
jgi:hypothetical protein